MTEMGSTIVAGYDGSPASRAALGWALAHLGSDGRLFVVTAFEPPPSWAAGPVAQQMLDERAGAARALLAEVEAEPSDGDGPVVIAEAIADDPARAIGSVAAVREADLVVVGSYGRGRIEASVVGSVVQGLLRTLDVPLLVFGEGCAERLAEEPAETVA